MLFLPLVPSAETAVLIFGNVMRSKPHRFFMDTVARDRFSRTCPRPLIAPREIRRAHSLKAEVLRHVLELCFFMNGSNKMAWLKKFHGAAGGIV